MKLSTPAYLFTVALILSACTPQTQPPAPTPVPSTPKRVPEKPEVKPEPEEPAVLLPPSPGIAQRPAVRDFIASMSRKHGFSEARLVAAFEQAGIHPRILEAMAKPYEAKPWYAYRKLFLTDKRIEGGRAFLSDQTAGLRRAESRYGVAPAMVTAIIGVESSYGARPGKYRVIDALSTLAFDYPRRSAYFTKELEQFLLLCREEGMDYLDPLGSYAGAMGMPQFMPSSYRKLSADGDGDGRRDIWNNPDDVIASVANYFAKNGWHAGEPIAVPARIQGEGYRQVVQTKKPKAVHTLAHLADLGVSPAERIVGNPKAALLQLPGEEGPEYWITFHNFSVIMRYNNSALYAMAANELVRAFEGD